MSSLFDTGDTPSRVQARIREAQPEGWQVLDQNDLRIAVGKLRLAGVYDDRQERWFMLRTRIAGGILTADQAETIASVAADFSLRPESDDSPERFVEITTRQNIQLHWLLFQHLPDVWDRFDAVGLTSLEACGNSLRNVTSCSVSGVAEEWIDARPAVRAVTRLALEGQEFTAFLPRKFKVAVSGCRTDCVIQHVHDLSFVAARGPSGVIGYNVLAGGGLSDYPRLSSPLGLFVSEDQVVPVVRAVLEVYREFGDYEHPAVNRFRMLVHQMGTESISGEVKARLPFEAVDEGEYLGDGTWEDHLGVNDARGGTHFVGLNVPVGRLTSDELAEVARLSRVYGNGEIRLTQRQDLVLTGVRDVGGLLGERLLERLSPDPDPFARGIVSCTSAPFCKFGILNVKSYGMELAEHLRTSVPRDRWDRLQGLRIHLSGCKASCAQPQLAHIGMRSTMTKDEDDSYDAFDLVMDGSNLRLGTWRDLEVRVPDAFARTAALVNELADRVPGSTSISDQVAGSVFGRDERLGDE